MIQKIYRILGDDLEQVIKGVEEEINTDLVVGGKQGDEIPLYEREMDDSKPIYGRKLDDSIKIVKTCNGDIVYVWELVIPVFTVNEITKQMERANIPRK